LTFTYP